MPIDFAAKMNIPDVPDEAPAEEVATEPEIPELEGPAEEEAADGLDEELTEEPAEEEAEEPVLEETPAPKLKARDLADTDKFTVDGKEITGKELKAGFMRQEDYTRKTQALAEERRTLKGENETLREENQEFVEWVSSFDNWETMKFELIRNFPAQYDNLRDFIISEAIEEQNLDENARAWKRRAEKAEVFRQAKEQDEARAATKAEKAAALQRTSELRTTFNTWALETLTAVGLDPKNADHQELVRSRVQSAFPANHYRWTKEHFAKAAEYIAKQLGVKAGEAKPKAKLPPTKPQGNRATPEAKEAKKIRPREDVGNGFARLREKYGLQ